MPEAPVISNAAVATTDDGDDGPSSEGSSIEPGDKPGETRSLSTPHPRLYRTLSSSGAGDGAMLLSQLRRR